MQIENMFSSKINLIYETNFNKAENMFKMYSIDLLDKVNLMLKTQVRNYFDSFSLNLSQK